MSWTQQGKEWLSRNLISQKKTAKCLLKAYFKHIVLYVLLKIPQRHVLCSPKAYNHVSKTRVLSGKLNNVRHSLI